MRKEIYQELYSYDSKHSLVMNSITGDVLMCKTSRYFDPAVYRFLEEHPDPHFPKIIDHWEEGGELTVIEEFIQGHTFDSIIHDKEMPDDRKIDYLIEICKALSFLHSAPIPIIYRDIKPSNIIVSSTGDIKIVDFDAAKTFKKGSVKDTVLLGTEGFAAPEQYGFGQSDQRTDIYTMGIMIRDMFAPSHRIQRVVEQATMLDPDDRYQSMEILIKKLEMSKGTVDQLTPVMLFPIPGFRSRKVPRMLLSTALYILGILLSLGISADGGGAGTTLSARLAYLCALFCIIDCCSDWTGFYYRFPFIRSNNLFVRIMAKTVLSVVILLAWCVVFGGINVLVLKD